MFVLACLYLSWCGLAGRYDIADLQHDYVGSWMPFSCIYVLD